VSDFVRPHDAQVALSGFDARVPDYEAQGVTWHNDLADLSRADLVRLVDDLRMQLALRSTTPQSA
jgi:hypothetical protein